MTLHAPDEPGTLTADQAIPADPEQAVWAERDERAPLTPWQQRGIQATLRRLGMNRDAGLALMSRATGRTVTTSRTLRRTEAALVLEFLRHEERLAAEPPLDADDAWKAGS